MDTPAVPLDHSFLDALRDLHRQAGYPSTREVAARTKGAISHAAVHDTLRGKSYPSWLVAKMIITALGREPEDYQDLWGRWRPAGSRNRSGWEDRLDHVAALTAALEANTAALDRLTAAVITGQGRAVPRPGKA